MRKSRIVSIISASLLVALTSTTFVPAAFAGSTGRRNTAIGLTAGTVYAAVRGKKGATLGLGAASALAWYQYSKARKSEVARRNYRSGYRRGYSAARYRSAGYGSGNRGRHVGWSHSHYYRGAHRGHRG